MCWSYEEACLFPAIKWEGIVSVDHLLVVKDVLTGTFRVASIILSKPGIKTSTKQIPHSTTEGFWESGRGTL